MKGFLIFLSFAVVKSSSCFYVPNPSYTDAADYCEYEYDIDGWILPGESDNLAAFRCGGGMCIDIVGRTYTYFILIIL